MFCPRCGQQLSGDVHFCSRCGMQLDAIKDLITTNGLLPDAANPIEISPRRKGIRLGGKFIFWSIGTLPLIIILASSMRHGENWGLVPFTLFLIGLLQIVYSWLFKENKQAPAKKIAWSNKQPAQIPPGSPLFIATPTPADTGEIINPPSITENTTNLLRDEKS